MLQVLAKLWLHNTSDIFMTLSNNLILSITLKISVKDTSLTSGLTLSDTIIHDYVHCSLIDLWKSHDNGLFVLFRCVCPKAFYN